jgi:hypothetical protein
MSREGIKGSLQPGKTQSKSASGDFSAVEVRCGAGACAAARALQSKRFLTRQSPPMLPLRDCTNPAKCNCKYVRHADRRDGNRRGDETGMWATILQPDQNRRSNPGRRKDD